MCKDRGRRNRYSLLVHSARVYCMQPNATSTAPSNRRMIHDLWDRLSDFTPCQADAALVHLFESLGPAVQADQIVWVAAVRIVDGSRAGFDAGHGWRAHAAEEWRAPLASGSHGPAARSRRSNDRENCADLITASIARDSGRFRLQGLHDRRRGASQPAAANARDGRAQVADRLWVVFPLNADTESYFVLDKTTDGARFSTSDAALAAYALRGIKWFHRQLLLGHGLVATERPLTLTERRVVRLLLTDRTEKEIAQALGLGFDTVHKHVGEIYRKFAVRGRTGLMALWLGGRV